MIATYYKYWGKAEKAEEDKLIRYPSFSTIAWMSRGCCAKMRIENEKAKRGNE